MKTMEQKINEFVDQIVREQLADVTITIEGWEQSSEWVGGRNPFCDDVVVCGKIVASEEPSLVGKIIKHNYHGSYSGVDRGWQFLDSMEECPKVDEFIPSDNLYDAGTQCSWKEGKFVRTLWSIKYSDMPNLDFWEIRRRELRDKINLIIKTRRKPGIKFGFENWGYKWNTSFSSYPRIPGDVESAHYQCGCRAVVATFYSWGRNVDYIEVERLA